MFHIFPCDEILPMRVSGKMADGNEKVVHICVREGILSPHSHCSKSNFISQYTVPINFTYLSSKCATEIKNYLPSLNFTKLFHHTFSNANVYKSKPRGACQQYARYKGNSSAYETSEARPHIFLHILTHDYKHMVPWIVPSISTVLLSRKPS
jgi:hypothetical protein